MKYLFDQAKFEILVIGAEELNRLKKEIDLTASLVARFLVWLSPTALKATKFQVGNDRHSYWEFIDVPGKKAQNRLHLVEPGGGLRIAYSNDGTGTVFALVKVVHGLLPQLLSRVMEEYPNEFPLFLQPFFEAGFVVKAQSLKGD